MSDPKQENKKQPLDEKYFLNPFGIVSASDCTGVTQQVPADSFEAQAYQDIEPTSGSGTLADDKKNKNNNK